MDVLVQITPSAILEPPRPALPEAGAWVEFRGCVRGSELGAPITGIDYEAYSPMAEREIQRILNDLTASHPCLAACVIHRVGFVPVGEAAVYVGVAGRHRGEAFALLGEFMDRLKADVPIWKARVVPAPAASVVLSPPPGPHAPHSADDVRALLGELCLPLESETVCLSEASGRVLRETVRALEDQPPFDRSSVDGFAVRLDDPAEHFALVGEVRAGDWKSRPLQPGEAVYIATGGALPCEGLQVVMREFANVTDGHVHFSRRDADPNIRFRGEDARTGQDLVASGTVLAPGTLALLASAGHVRPRVTRLPRVRHLATGNEIVSPDTALRPGQVRDSNSTLVRAFLEQWKIVPEQSRLGEDRALLDQVLAGPDAEDLDLLLISGGASVGTHDFTQRALVDAGFTVHVARTTARPGKPLIVARRGRTLAFGLPGNPLAHFVCLNLYVRGALEAWSGQTVKSGFEAGLLDAPLGDGPQARETFWPARWAIREGAIRLMPLRWCSSGDLTALATANALMRVASGTGQHARGARMWFLRTDRSS